MMANAGRPGAGKRGLGKLGVGCALFGRSVPGAGSGISEAEAFAIVALAADAGVTLVDTAAQWTGSEGVLGQVLPSGPAMRVVTKTAALTEGVDGVERRARASLAHLGLDRGHALLVHRAGDLLGPEGPMLWRRMQRLKAEGLFEAIGICACVCDDPLGLARRFKPDIMQAPASLLDQRLITDGTLEAIADLGVRIHLRSVLLHGLLFRPGHELPVEVSAMAPWLSRLRRTLAEAGADPLQSALSFALSQPAAEAVIVGVRSTRELRAILAAAAAPGPELDWSSVAMDAPCVLTPRRCKAA